MHDLDEAAFAMFASIYPHEAYRLEPVRFLRYAKDVSGKEPEEILECLRESVE